MSALIHYTRPATSLSSLVDEFLNDGFFSMADRDISSSHWPRVDIVEEKNAYTLTADLPGMEKKDISISVEKGVLNITGEKKDEKKAKEKGHFYHYERNYGKFVRSFNVPDDVDTTSIEANYSNGVLELKLKKNEKALPKSIDIKVN